VQITISLRDHTFGGWHKLLEAKNKKTRNIIELFDIRDVKNILDIRAKSVS